MTDGHWRREGLCRNCVVWLVTSYCPQSTPEFHQTDAPDEVQGQIDLLDWVTRSSSAFCRSLALSLPRSMTLSVYLCLQSTSASLHWCVPLNVFSIRLSPFPLLRRCPTVCLYLRVCLCLYAYLFLFTVLFQGSASISQYVCLHVCVSVYLYMSLSISLYFFLSLTLCLSPPRSISLSRSLTLALRLLTFPYP